MNEGLQTWLDTLAAAAEKDMAAQNAVRDEALSSSRSLIRLCSRAIRSGHRNDWDAAETLLAEADEVGRQLLASLAPYPELMHAGYTQDALKELVEARVTLALISERDLPAFETSGIPMSTYVNGVCEAASELRRRCLDEMRREAFDEAERLLGAMDMVYEVLMSFGYPDAITHGLRRRVDQLRGVLERTRGDLTNSLQMMRLRRRLEAIGTEESPAQ